MRYVLSTTRSKREEYVEWIPRIGNPKMRIQSVHDRRCRESSNKKPNCHSAMDAPLQHLTCGKVVRQSETEHGRCHASGEASTAARKCRTPSVLRRWRRQRAAEEATCRVNARERGGERGTSKKMVTAPARRELVRWMHAKGLSERRGLRIMSTSASSLRYVPRPDRNQKARHRIIELAQRHRRCGVGMIHLKVRQAGEF